MYKRMLLLAVIVLFVGFGICGVARAADDTQYKLLVSQDDPGTGYIVDWVVCGPFFSMLAEDYESYERYDPRKVSRDHLVAADIGGEPGVKPFPGYSFFRGPVWFQWLDKHSETPGTNFLSEYSYLANPKKPRWPFPYTHARDRCMYAVCYLEVPREMKVRLRVWVAAKDTPARTRRVYVGDKLLASLEDKKDAAEWIYDCQLKRGRNRLLLRVPQTMGSGFEFKAGIEITQGREASQIMVRLQPNSNHWKTTPVSPHASNSQAGMC